MIALTFMCPFACQLAIAHFSYGFSVSISHLLSSRKNGFWHKKLLSQWVHLCLICAEILKDSVVVINQRSASSIIDVWERTSVTHFVLNVTSLKVHNCGWGFIVLARFLKPLLSTGLHQDQEDNKCPVLDYISVWGSLSGHCSWLDQPVCNTKWKMTFMSVKIMLVDVY